MATNLKFGTTDICYSASGDVYNLVSQNRKQANTVDIFFPNTAGRTIRVTGTQNTSDTAESYEFEGFIFKTSQSALDQDSTLMTAIENYMIDDDSMIQTLEFATPNQDGIKQTITGMRMLFEVTSPTIKRNAAGDAWYITFRARFEKYTV